MRKKGLIIIMLIFLLMITGCNSGKNEEKEDALTENIPNEQHIESEEDSKETINTEEIEWYQEYGNRKVLLTYVWADDASVYGLSEESADFIDQNDEIFPTENKAKIADLINKDITYKHIEKSYEKYTANIFEIEEGYILSIEEANIEEFGLITLLHVMDEDLQSYQIMYFDELPNIFKEDIIYVAGLPIGMGGFENVSGGYTNTVVTLGSYIEKIE